MSWLKDILQRLFDFFIHLASSELEYSLDAIPIGDKITDPEFIRSFTLNQRPLVTLLERGYMQRHLENEVPPKYILFLAQMLQRPMGEMKPEVMSAVCNQVALQAAVEQQREMLISEGALLPLIEALRSNHDVILLGVVKALINLSSGNLAAKDSIVNEGGIRSLIPHLLNKSDELTKSFCILLKNCLTASDLRERIVNDGAVAPLVKLLHVPEVMGATRSEDVVAAAAAAVWNISVHEGAKTIVLREKGVEALARQLRESRSEDVWQKCAGCIMVLAANSDEVKRMVGEEMAVPALTRVVLSHAGVGEQPKVWRLSVLKAALGALAVLSSDERNLAAIRAEGLESEVEKYKRSKDEKIIAFVQQLMERMFVDPNS